MTVNRTAPIVVSDVIASAYVFATGGCSLAMDAAACRAVVVAFAPLRTATFPLHLDIALVVSSNARALNRTERALLSCSVIWFAYVCTSPFVHSIFGAADVVRPERIALPYWTFPCPCVFPAPHTIEPIIDLSYAPNPMEQNQFHTML